MSLELTEHEPKIPSPKHGKSLSSLRVTDIFNGKFHHIQDYPLELDQDVLPGQFFNLFPN